jgi:DNA-binding NtrC family response regulator
MIAIKAAPHVFDRSLAVIIDDDSHIREFIGATLRMLGMKVEGYTMAIDALAAIDDVHPAVIFLDVALLRSDAIDVLRGLGERHYCGLVQLMSGGRLSLLEAIQRIGMRHGIKLAPPLNKPVAREAIVRVIEKLRSGDALSLADS